MEVTRGTGQQLYDRISDKQFFQMMEGDIWCEGYDLDKQCPQSAWIIATLNCGCSDMMCYLCASNLHKGINSEFTSVYCDTCGTRDLSNIELVSVLDFLIGKE